MKVLFIAGPFRANCAWDIEQNIRRAESLSLDCWRAGAAVLCPHTNTRFFQDAAPDPVWLVGTKELLTRCDGVIFLDGWRMSAGSVSEHYTAKERNMPIFYADSDGSIPDDLRAWIGEDNTENSVHYVHLPRFAEKS